MFSFSPEERHALLLSTLAGLSTSIGGAIAVSVLPGCQLMPVIPAACTTNAPVRQKFASPTRSSIMHAPLCIVCLQIVKRPGPGLLSFLLGIAIGVMVTLSALEMYIRNAYEHGFWGITLAAGCGVALYYFVQPFLPDFADHSHEKKSAEVRTECLTPELECASALRCPFTAKAWYLCSRTCSAPPARQGRERATFSKCQVRRRARLSVGLVSSTTTVISHVADWCYLHRNNEVQV